MRSTSESSPISVLTLLPLKNPQPLMQTRVIVPNRLQIAFEQRAIPYIKASNCGVKSDIRLRDMFAKQKRGFMFGKMSL